MKKSVLTVLFALFCTMSFAQLSFNVKAGLNLSSYIGDNSDHSKFKPGVRLGVGMEYQFTDIISLQPSLFFSQKGAKYSDCLLYTSPSPRDRQKSRMPSSA